jgi:hypothetical protein
MRFQVKALGRSSIVLERVRERLLHDAVSGQVDAWRQRLWPTREASPAWRTMAARCSRSPEQAEQAAHLRQRLLAGCALVTAVLGCLGLDDDQADAVQVDDNESTPAHTREDLEALEVLGEEERARVA